MRCRSSGKGHQKPLQKPPDAEQSRQALLSRMSGLRKMQRIADFEVVRLTCPECSEEMKDIKPYHPGSKPSHNGT